MLVSVGLDDLFSGVCLECSVDGRSEAVAEVSVVEEEWVKGVGGGEAKLVA